MSSIQSVNSPSLPPQPEQPGARPRAEQEPRTRPSAKTAENELPFEAFIDELFGPPTTQTRSAYDALSERLEGWQITRMQGGLVFEQQGEKVVARPGRNCIVVGFVALSGVTQWATATADQPIPAFIPNRRKT